MKWFRVSNKKILNILFIALLLQGCDAKAWKEDDPVVSDLSQQERITFIDSQLLTVDKFKKLYLGSDYARVGGIMELTDETCEELLIDFYPTDLKAELTMSLIGDDYKAEIEAGEKDYVLEKEGEYRILVDNVATADFAFTTSFKLENGHHYVVFFGTPEYVLKEYSNNKYK